MERKKLTEMTKEEVICAMDSPSFAKEYHDELAELSLEQVAAGEFVLPTVIMTTVDGANINTGITHESLR